MARSNTASTSNYYTGSNVNLTGYPMTLACWFYPFNLTSTSVLLATSNAAADSYHALQFDGSNAYGLGDNFIVHDCDAAQMSASASAVAAANTWNHAVAVLTSATSRTVYLNGVAGTPNTTSRTPASQNHLNVGVLQGSGGTFRPIDGRIAEAGFWNVALTAAEVLMLSKSVSPLLIRPNNLLRYFPLIGYGEERCRITRNLLTETGSMARAEHSRVFYPSSPLIGFKAVAGGGTDALLADDVSSASSVGTPAIGQVHALAANDVSSASSVTTPALGQAHVLAANDVASASSVGSPAIGQVHALLANDVGSASTVTAPAFGQVHVLAANDVGSASTVSAPVLAEVDNIDDLLAEDVASVSTVSVPSLGQVHALAANDVGSASSVSSPVLTIVGAEESVRPSGGGWSPIIYLDDKGRPVDLKTYKARTANQAIQAATKAVKELPKEDRQEAREALRALREAVAAGVAERVAEEARALALLLGELQGLLAKLEEIARQEALDDEAIIILLLVA